MLNAFFMKANNTEINPTSKEIEMYGLFFTEHLLKDEFLYRKLAASISFGAP